MPVYLLSEELVFPPPHLANKEGLLAVGGDLSIDRLLLAYRNGIFPWYADGDPILWWSPDPRMILYPKDLKISRSLRKTLRKGHFQVTFDTQFEQVIGLCAQTRIQAEEGTWITDEMARAYTQLHRIGYGHSVETWYDGRLVGGLYGVTLGRCFFGESMFSLMSDASKVALIHLGEYLRSLHFNLIDCQIPSGHLQRMGALEIAREEFLIRLSQALQYDDLTGVWNGSKRSLKSIHFK